MERMRQRSRTNLKFMSTFLTLAMISGAVFFSSPASAALPAPKWTPGMPMMAGPQVILMWQVVPGAAKYRVYMNDKEVTETPGIQHIVPAPTAAGKYSFSLKAVGVDGSLSPASEVKVISIIKLEPPTNLQALTREDRITVRWNRAEGAVIYDVHRREKGKEEYSLLASIQDLLYQDTSVTPGVVYEYAVSSKDSTGKASALSTALESTIAVKETGAEAFEGYEMHSLPMKRVAHYIYDFYVVDLDIRDNRAVVVGDVMLYYPDIRNPQYFRVGYSNAEGAVNLPQVKGVSFDKEGMVLTTAKDTIYRINPVSSVILDTYQAPPPEEKTLLFQRRKVEEMKNPTNLIDVAEGPDGSIYATDNGNSRVVAFSPEGDFMGTLGWNPEQAEEVVRQPDWLVPQVTRITVSPDGRIFANSVFQIYVYTPDGELEARIGQMGNVVGSFGMVAGEAFDTSGNLWVTDLKNGTVQVFKEEPENPAERRWIPVYAGTNPTKTANPRFNKPTSLAWGPAGPSGPRLYVIESITKSIAWFDVFWDQVEK